MIWFSWNWYNLVLVNVSCHVQANTGVARDCRNVALWHLVTKHSQLIPMQAIICVMCDANGHVGPRGRMSCQEGSRIMDDMMGRVLITSCLLGLFLLGFLTLRVDGRAALVATIVTAFSVGGWLWVDSAVADRFFPFWKVQMPDKLWVGTLANTLLFALAYGVSWIVVNRHDRPLNGLTIWTTTKQHPVTEE